MKLQELTAKQWIGPLFATQEIANRFPTPKKNRQSYNEIKKELDQYLDAQLLNATDEAAAPPEQLRRYLALQTVNLEAISTHIANSEIPRWKIDIKADPEYPLPGFFSFTTFQQLLALDMLEKNREGKTREVLENLEAAWKLNQSVREQPYLIAQLVASIVDRIQAGVLRKIDGVPASWQRRIGRLIERDARQLFLRSLEVELAASSQQLKNYGWRERPDSEWPVLSKLMRALQQPYFRFAAIDYWNNTRAGIAQLSKQNFCAFEPDTFDKQVESSFAWWNFLERDMTGALLRQWRKVDGRLIDWELTQKILQVKAIAAKTGKWPQKVLGIESSICRDAKWIYKVSADGTMSLSFRNAPKWIEERQQRKGNLPLTYSAKLKKSEQQ